MAGAEAVRADPLHALIIALDGGKVKAAAADVGILVLAETAQVNALAIEQEMAILNLEGTDADLVAVLVNDLAAVHDADDKGVQVSGVDVPQLGIGNLQRAGLAAGFGNLGAAVIDLNHNIMIAIGDDGVVGLGAALNNAVDN